MHPNNKLLDKQLGNSTTDTIRTNTTRIGLYNPLIYTPNGTRKNIYTDGVRKSRPTTIVRTP